MSNELFADLCRKIKQATYDRRIWAKAQEDFNNAKSTLAKAQEQAEASQKEAIKALEAHDVKSDGNYGWEKRWWYFMDQLLKENDTDWRRTAGL